MAESPRSDRSAAWVREATWYELDVLRFRNGNADNDPQGLKPWPTKSESAGQDIGADLQGLKTKLPYLKDLGFNALILKGLFAGDGKHIIRSIAAGGAECPPSETADPATWSMDANDRVFLDVLEDARKSGFRVVAEFPAQDIPQAPSEELGTFLIHVGKRWCDPNGDGKCSKGLDGWVTDMARWPAQYATRWAAEIKKACPQSVLLGLPADSENAKPHADLADAVIDGRPAASIVRFFAGDSKVAPKTLLDELQVSTKARSDGPTRLIRLNGPDDLRIRSALPAGPDAALARVHLAVMIQHFLPGSPLTRFGDEVGMTGSARQPDPMWWSDLPDPNSKPSEYRSEMPALVRWLHSRRAVDRPMVEGEFRTVLADEEKKLLAFGRTLGKDETILLINYGTTKQKAVIAGQWAGKTVGVLIPSVQAPQATRPKPGETPKPPPDGPLTFRVNGSRQFVGDDGEVSVPIGGLSARVILIREGELR